jgi:hypothetical protein
LHWQNAGLRFELKSRNIYPQMLFRYKNKYLKIKIIK